MMHAIALTVCVMRAQKSSVHTGLPMSLPQDFTRRRFTVWLGMIVLGFAALRGPLVRVPMERDEGENAMMGLGMLHGIPPYSDAYMMKLPGGAALDALIFATLGPTTRSLHLALLLMNVVSIAMVGWLGRSLISGSAGLFAAAAYGTFTIGMGMYGPWLSSEHVAVLFLLAGACLTCRATGSGDIGVHDFVAELARVRFSGSTFLRTWLHARNVVVPGIGMICLGMAMVVKQHAAFPAFAWALVVGVIACRDRAWGSRLKWFAGALLAFFTPLILTTLIMAWCGVFEKFWFWTFTYAARYASSVPLWLGWEYFKISAGKIFMDASLLWIMSGAGFVVLLWKPPSPGARWLLLLSTLGGAAAASAGLMFRPQYFILLAPFAALLAGVTWNALVGRIRRAALRLLVCTCLVIASFVVLVEPLLRGINQKSDGICREVYGMNPFPEYPLIADYVRKHTRPEDRLAILGSEPGIYFLADRRPAMPHVCIYEMMKPHAYARQMQAEAIQEIEKAKPPCVVLVDAESSWKRRPESEPMFYRWSLDFLREHYVLDGMIDLVSCNEVIVRWDEEARAYKPQSEHTVQIFKRKAEKRP